MQILFAFNHNEIIENIEQVLNDEGIVFDSVRCETKIDVLRAVCENKEIGALIMLEDAGYENPWSSYEISRLIDGRDINVIPLLKDNRIGSDYVKQLLSVGITNALFGSVHPKDIAKLIAKPRTRKEARVYYNLEDAFYSVTDIAQTKINGMVGYLDRAKSQDEIIERFDNICSELNQEQIEKLIKLLNSDVRTVIRESNTYKVYYGKKKVVLGDGFRLPEFPKSKKDGFNILYGFENDNLIDNMEKELKDNGYTVQSMVKYNKAGIKNYLLANTDVDTLIVVENLEKRSGYEAEELIELSEICDVNIIVLAGTDKQGSEFINKLYCAGITSVILGIAKREDIYRLVVNGRSRQEARKHYGLKIGTVGVPVLCNKYYGNIEYYLRHGKGDLVSKCQYIKAILSSEQLADILKRLPEDLKLDIEGTEVFGVNKKNRKKKEQKASIVVELPKEKKVEPEKVKSEKPTKEKKAEKTQSEKKKIDKRYIIAGIVLLIITAVAILVAKIVNGKPGTEPMTVYNGENVYMQGYGTENNKIVETTYSDSVVIDESTKPVETENVVEPTIIVTEQATIEITTTVEMNETTVEETVPESTTKKKEKTTEKVTEKTTESKTEKATEKITEKVTEKKTEESPTKKKANNTVPSQKEDTSVIGKENHTLIRNTVRSNVSGPSYSSNMENLAIYCAKNGTKASSAADSLCGYNTLEVSSITKAVKVSSTASEDMLNAAIELADKIRGDYTKYSSYGVGISAKFSQGQYTITVVMVFEE